MKKKQLIAGALVAAALATGAAVASEGVTTTLTVFKGGINVLKDGAPLNLKDAGGNPVEPMIYNGTTYLPVRAVAEAAGLDVDWDGATRTVFLGEKESVDFDQIGTHNFQSSTGVSTYGSVSGNYELNYNVPYANFERGVKYVTNFQRDTRGVSETITDDYFFNKEYKRFTGTLYCRYESGGDTSIMKVYGDGKLLYTAPNMRSNNSLPVYFDIDIEGVDTMTLEFVHTDLGTQIDKILIIGDGKLLK